MDFKGRKNLLIYNYYFKKNVLLLLAWCKSEFFTTGQQINR